MFDTVQGLVFLALWVVTLAVKAFAFVDCIRRPKEAFPAVRRESKSLWLILTSLAAGAGVYPAFTLNIIGSGRRGRRAHLPVRRGTKIEITSRRW